MYMPFSFAERMGGADSVWKKLVQFFCFVVWVSIWFLCLCFYVFINLQYIVFRGQGWMQHVGLTVYELGMNMFDELY